MHQKTYSIQIVKDGLTEPAQVIVEIPTTYQLTILFANNQTISSQGTDVFDCFVKIREQTPDMIYLCKGAKRNVYPSRMARGYGGGGFKAYECTMGQQALRENLVEIFDYEDNDVAVLPSQQLDFF